MKKMLLYGLVAGLAGAAVGWWRFQANYGGVAQFGPFSSDTMVPASEVSLRKLPAGTPGKSPKLEVVGGEEYNFGVMEPGAQATHKFVIRNVGESPLELGVIGSTCKCTVGKLDNPLVQPGGETEVVMTWTAKSNIEEFGQSATMRSNDPNRSEFSLKVIGRVVSSMAMSPRTLAIGDVESGETIRLENVIYSFSKSPIKPVQQVISDLDLNSRTKFQVEEIDPKDGGDSAYASAVQAFRLKTEIGPGYRQGPIRENLTFEFVPATAFNEAGDYDSDLISRFTAEVTGRIVGVITLVQSQRVFSGEEGYIFTMGEVDPAEGKPMRANLLVRGPDREKIKLAIGEVKPAGLLKAELGEPVGRSTTVLVPLMISVDPAAKPIDMMGRGTDDFGFIEIRGEGVENVSPMVLRVRFAVPKK
jgi:hypothetical protein